MADQEMNSPGTTGLQREEDLGDDPTTPVAFVSGVNESNASDSRPESPSPETPPSDSGAKPQAPMQKRRRVTRACDECRRKKIKCDGKQPCTHCTVYSYGVFLTPLLEEDSPGPIWKPWGADWDSQSVHMISHLTEDEILHRNTLRLWNRDCKKPNLFCALSSLGSTLTIPNSTLELSNN